MNKYLKSVTKYMWMSAGALFICYLYFVGSLTFSIIKQQSLEHSTKVLISSMSTEELAYLSSQKNLTESYAKSIGLVSTTAISFAPGKRAVAFNVGR